MRRISKLIWAFRRHAVSAEVLQKAQRLQDTGAVTILNNQPQYIRAHVVGDHGQYITEITRRQGSNGIDDWSCQCEWGKYAFGRSRRFKSLEGQPCSHVYATFWQARSTPLDAGSYDKDRDGKMPGQRRRDLEQSQWDERRRRWDQIMEERGYDTEERDRIWQAIEQMQQPQAPDTEQRSFGPDEPSPQYPEDHGQRNEPYESPGQQGYAPIPPSNPFVQHPQPFVPQRQHMQIPGVPDEAPDAAGFSEPQDEPPPGTLGFPGAFSSLTWRAPIIHVSRNEFFRWSANLEEERVENAVRSGRRIVVELARSVMLEQRGGKIPLPGAQPQRVNDEGVEVYRALDLGYDPDLGERVYADSAALGAPENRGVYTEAHEGTRAEIMDWDPVFKQVLIDVPLHQSGPLHPHRLEGWVSLRDVTLLPDVAPSPYGTGKRR